MSESSSKVSPDLQRRSRIASGVSHLNRQAARTGKAAVGTVLAAALLSGMGASPAAALETTGELPVVSPDQGVLWDNAPVATEPTVTERLGGVAEELDRAVSRGEVTLDQALAFFAQIQARAIGQ
ncbi:MULTISPECIES: hypothetical protein [Kocuria]|uniref:Uncharacterized protein n=1 Tax=Kocuria subflava TaxID=1736139 RepID=A0A846TLZ8_9MICC|nr:MULTISPECIES: hypothetical protein [Kocuria]NKE09473.1 hypothetical protein [Kocuria subflava]